MIKIKRAITYLRINISIPSNVTYENVKLTAYNLCIGALRKSEVT